MRSLILFAPNVGGGGGLVLLLELLKANWPGLRQIAILDERARTEIGNGEVKFDVHWSKPSLVGRWKAERLAAKLASPGDVILCFHNLPPVFSSAGRIFVYVQNAILVGLIPASQLSGWTRWRSMAELAIARRLRGRVERYMVQTETMATALGAWFGPGAPSVDVLPFAAESATISAGSGGAGPLERRWDFLYPSDGAQHKNHARLFAAWEWLAGKGQYPSLAVTLHPTRDGRLRGLLDTVVSRSGARINDLGWLSHAEALLTYRQAGAMIFPSTAESFGIPILEAKAAGLPVLAPELDYVRDLLDPVETFDPTSLRSIGRAVLRFMALPPERHAVLRGQDVADAIASGRGADLS